DGTWAYTSTWSFRAEPGNTVYVWNVTGDTPQRVDSLHIENASTTGDVQISDDGTLLVVATEYAGGSIVIYDRSDPAHPELITRFQSASTTPGVHTVKLGRVDGRHYAFLSIDPVNEPPQPARLVIVDITDPDQPVQVTSLTIGDPFVHDVFVRDGWLFTALWNDGMRIYDIGGAGAGGTPAAPVALGTVETVGGQVHNMWWFHDPSGTADGRRYVFVGQEGPSPGGSASGDIHVVDISNAANPREVAFYTVAGAGTHNFSMDEASGILYAAYYNGGVRALDVRGDLSDCTAAQQAPDGRCDLTKMGRELAVGLDTGDNYVWGVQFVDGFVYASDMQDGIYKLDARELAR
ncbi:MAG: LVIVD repeat-containing protein, partial [Longimicrobiales bacterium]